MLGLRNQSLVLLKRKHFLGQSRFCAFLLHYMVQCCESGTCLCVQYQLTRLTCSCRSGSEYTRVLNTNVVGPFLVTKHVLPLLKKRQTKVVVNTSSVCGSISTAAGGAFGGLLLPYNSSKAAINMRTLLGSCNVMCLLHNCCCGKY